MMALNLLAEKGTAAILRRDDFEFTLSLPSCLAQKKPEHLKKIIKISSIGPSLSTYVISCYKRHVASSEKCLNQMEYVHRPENHSIIVRGTAKIVMPSMEDVMM
jgi:hypothetical protein